MAAVSPLFCVSSPESSPVKLEGPGFVVYRVCKRIRDTGDPVSSQYIHVMSLPLRDLDDKDIELQCGTVLRQGTLVRHTFFGEAIARGVDSWVLLDPVE